MRVTRVLREVVKQAWTPKEMHKLLGSTDDSSVEQLRELYLVRVREIHPDTAGPDAGDIEIHELKDIYDKLIERRIESETSVHGQRQVPWTVEDYRAGRHKSKATLTHYFYSNAFRFWIMIPMMIIMTEMSYDIVTGKYRDSIFGHCLLNRKMRF